MPRVIHFEIHAMDPNRTTNFYIKTFGWKFSRWKGPGNDYWMIDTGKGDGINGGMARVDESDVEACNTIDVKDIDKTIKDIKKNGGKIIMPKHKIPKVGYHAIFRDTEGNVFGLIEMDKKTK